jgi:tRNA threonylcarbamoyladenosine modification (KEOPS) complex Cgi121 subunit
MDAAAAAAVNPAPAPASGAAAGDALPPPFARLTFELFPSRSLALALFTGVANAAAVRDAVLAKTLDVALLNPALVASPGAVHVAANRALHAQVAVGKLRAASLHAELVACLHGGRNVGEALRALGAPAGAGALLVCVFDAAPDELARLAGLVDGAPTALADFFPHRVDASAVRELYRVAPEELAPPVGGGGDGSGATAADRLADAVIGRIAVQEYIGGTAAVATVSGASSSSSSTGV